MNQYHNSLRIRRKSVCFFLVLLFTSGSYVSPLCAQTTEAVSKDEQERSPQAPEVQSQTTTAYLEKFSSMSEILEASEKKLESLVNRIEAVQAKEKKAETKDQKAFFKDNIKGLKKSKDRLSSEIKLFRKGLRLLHENREAADEERKEVLNEITAIEHRILNLSSDSPTVDNTTIIQKNDVAPEGITIDERDVYMNPPPEKCKVVYDGLDATTKKPRKEVEPELLFGYTHPKLKNFFKENDFLTCKSKIVLLDNKAYVWFYITISSKDALKSYGRIEQGSTLKFELLTGDILYLRSAKNAVGELEAYSGNTTYEVILPLDRTNYKQLSKGEIDRVGIMWTSGYEQYEVYNTDMIMNQIQCLNEN